MFNLFGKKQTTSEKIEYLESKARIAKQNAMNRQKVLGLQSEINKWNNTAKPQHINFANLKSKVQKMAKNSGIKFEPNPNAIFGKK